ncbi:MAG: hypothetical protein ACWA42_10805 [Lutibacter sp.]
MRKQLFVMVFGFVGILGFSQNTNVNLQQNAGQRILGNVTNKGVTLGGYAQIDYNDPEGSKVGNLDVHRLVMLLGYKFNDKVSFLTELEYEHVKEVSVEQAYVQYKLNSSTNVLAGLMLVPMGIINEYHEPTTYYGVERPNVDKYIVPSTWREIGIGINGNIINASLKYQAYLFNGFASYKNGVGLLRGVDGLRKGRQKGAESTVSSPNFSAKLDFYGIQGLRLGVSTYLGKTQSDDTAIDGSTVGISMFGFDARYRYKKLQFRGQYITTNLSDTDKYNTLTGKDLGSAMYGFYSEIAYDFKLKGVEVLTPFFRYENYDTNSKTDGIARNLAYERSEFIFGLNYKVANGAAFKIDYQYSSNKLPNTDSIGQLNAGVGIWF